MQGLRPALMFIMMMMICCLSPARTTSPMASPCHLKPEPGMCLAYMPSYYYDYQTGDCKTFIYGGCGGNGNRFSTKQECTDRCVTSSDEPSGDLCQQKAEPGRCRGYFPKFFYNADSGLCEKFVFGGCGGNGNKFDTLEECQRECPHHGAIVAPSAPEAVCQQQAETGLCRGYFPKFFHNPDTGVCEQFIYGGCGGNGNNFDTLEECQKECSA